MPCDFEPGRLLPGHPIYDNECYPAPRVNCFNSVGRTDATAYALLEPWSPTCHMFKNDYDLYLDTLPLNFNLFYDANYYSPAKYRCGESVGHRSAFYYDLYGKWNYNCAIFKENPLFPYPNNYRPFKIIAWFK